MPVFRGFLALCDPNRNEAVMARAHAFAARSIGTGIFRKPRHLVLFAIAATAANRIPTTAGHAEDGTLTWMATAASNAKATGQYAP